jgi:dihydroflavonol-4-reductase
VRAAVTGANGFIGRNLVKGLLQAGHEVLSIVRRAEKATMLRALGSDVAVLELDRENSLASLMEGVNTLYHLANVMVFATKKEQWRSNVLNMKSVLRAARQAGVERVVYTSSVAVYGDTGDRWATEDFPRRPTTHYGRTKVWAEDLLSGEAEGMAWNILRPGVVYGPGSPLLYHTARRGPVLLHDGSNWVPLVHVVDVVRASLEVVRRAPSGRTYNVVDDRPLRLREFLEVIARETGVPLRRASYGMAFSLATLVEMASRVRGRPPKLTRDVLRLYRTSVRASNSRIKEEVGLQLKYPDPLKGLPEALARVSETFAL